ncbi:DUF6939 family protein [Streptomyces sp. NPDC058442]|uniref:DUF6939 family protein n=1 Tax=Streptomyces sp. NPDC058442 TaxID=3346503 RepID=UPI003655D70A
MRLSPFCPHGGIPVPCDEGVTGQSVEGIRQALRVFRQTDVDPAKLEITAMKGLKRTVRRYGPVQGHRTGLHGDRLLPCEAARRRICLPAHRRVLEHRVADLVEPLRDEQDVVLLDYTTDGDVADPTTPLSRAALIQLYMEGRWPREAAPGHRDKGGAARRPAPATNAQREIAPLSCPVFSRVSRVSRVSRNPAGGVARTGPWRPVRSLGA